MKNYRKSYFIDLLCHKKRKCLTDLRTLNMLYMQQFGNETMFYMDYNEHNFLLREITE